VGLTHHHRPFANSLRLSRLSRLARARRHVVPRAASLAKFRIRPETHRRRVVAVVPRARARARMESNTVSSTSFARETRSRRVASRREV